MATTPQDRKPKAQTKAQAAKLDKQQREMLANMMSTGIDFSPFTIDAGDGVEWKFSPDPLPAQTEGLIKAMQGASEAVQAREGMAEAFDELTNLIRDRLIDEEQKREFPKPIYGTQALMFFAMHLATGRDGFPTDEA